MRPRHARIVLPTLALALVAAAPATAQISITPDTSAANLADALFDSSGLGCVTPVAGLSSHTSGTAKSSGIYTIGSGTPYGMTTPKGIVLSTGDVADYASGANSGFGTTTSYAVAANTSQENMLDSIPGPASPYDWHDVTELSLAFVAPASFSGRLVFEVVFATEEWSLQMHNDAFGLFHNGANLATWNGHSVYTNHPSMAPFAETDHESAIMRLPGNAQNSAVMTFVSNLIAPSTAHAFTFIIGDHSEDTIDSTVYISMHTEDCDGNLIADYCDVVTATVPDANTNGIPDGCESVGIDVETYCVCDGEAIWGPCGNNVPLGIVAGCVNSTGQGGRLAVSGGGTACPAAVSFDISDVLPNGVGILVMSSHPLANAPALGDGRLCMRSPFTRTAIMFSNPVGDVSLPLIPTPSGGLINCGDTRYFQYWYRDPSGPCMKLSNVTNAVKVTF
ncbi:MAG: choice-of-anchor L domain-containing protein [Planctomycetes bacterium]|nr:choice-of-anchor L domain-containing protein [Planctomycetota bacterium]